MGEIVSTRLRYIASKDAEKILIYVNSLPYRIEIKGNPILKGKKWFLWFNLPDSLMKEMPSGDLD